METDDTITFLKEREARLGAPIIYRTYSTWFARLGGEKREYGVFLYTDGQTMVYEDFDRPPMILGIPIHRKNKEPYVKLEDSFPLASIISIDRVTKNAAERSMVRGHDTASSASLLSKAFRRLVTKVTLSDGSVMFFELMDHKGFLRMVEKARRDNGRVQGI